MQIQYTIQCNTMQVNKSKDTNVLKFKLIKTKHNFINFYETYLQFFPQLNCLQNVL